MPYCPQDKRQLYAEALASALIEARVTMLTEVAMFLGQIAYESGELRYWEEQADGSAYEGRKDLGNINVGDGRKFKGRGPIQLTGRANYHAAGLALGIDLENFPDLASSPYVGMRVAVWFWVSNALPALADLLNFEAVTRVINGGTNGLVRREFYYHRALEVLGRDVTLAALA